MDVGLRVVRGPDWKWGEQDGGEGHIGTVVEIGKAGSTTSPDKTVVVQWDSGSRTNYRVGYQGAFDLRLFDNAPLGIRHESVTCDTCHKQHIMGIRWKCTKCHNFDLCTKCYMADKHDTNHSFFRHDKNNTDSPRVKVQKRSGSKKLFSRGIFQGAKVVRGPDWDWGVQDGGEGSLGKVVDIRGWEAESERSVACVSWVTGITNVYRLGHKGKVDIKYVTDAAGPTFYPDHLPVLGQVITPTAQHHTQFKVGDKVKVDLEVDILKAMQEGHGGWNPRMAEHIGKVGTVHRITEKGDIRVQYESCSNRWTFHAGALTLVQQFNAQDIVRVIDDQTLVKKLQKDHGEWTDQMKTALGRSGKVLKVYTDGDLRVAVAGHTWTFNPSCCDPDPIPPDINKTGSHASLGALFQKYLDLQNGPDILVREAAQGRSQVVKEIITKHPDKIDQKSSGKTALQVASHQGHYDLVKMLIQSGANLECQDEDGDSALHYSAFGNQPDVMELLISKGAKVDALNNGECSPLHVAVNKQHANCVKVLLKHKAQVNIQVPVCHSTDISSNRDVFTAQHQQRSNS